MLNHGSGVQVYMRAYVLIDVDPGHEMDIINGSSMSAGVSSFVGVVQADVVYGSHDIVVVVEEDPKAVDETIMKLREIPHERKTESLLTMN
jgi:predicted ribosome-associated RNA-binding protein Tma20